jgi:hypothetical protein
LVPNENEETLAQRIKAPKLFSLDYFAAE